MLRVDHIKKIHTVNQKPVEALHDISLEVEKREFVAVVGPSGCGKTTLLRILAGLDMPTAGEVLFQGKPIAEPSRSRGMVFQQFSLFPWLTVKENIAFGLKLARQDSQLAGSKVESLINSFGLQGFQDTYPNKLSGGMQQRVAIARTMVVDPEVILMDEPFGSLDAQTRTKMQEFLSGVYERTHKTIVFVTHDIEEAIFLADKVYVLSQRPAVVKTIYDVEFDRPRKHELKHSDGFFKLKVKIAEALESLEQ